MTHLGRETDHTSTVSSQMSDLENGLRVWSLKLLTACSGRYELRLNSRPSLESFVGWDDTVGNPHRAQISRFELSELKLIEHHSMCLDVGFEAFNLRLCELKLQELTS